MSNLLGTTPIALKTNSVEEGGPNAEAQLLNRPLKIHGSSTFGLSIMVMTYRVGRQKNSDYSTHTQKAASQLEHAINDWASKVLRIAPAPAATLQEAVLTDITDVGERSALFWDVLPITVQCLLRHALTWVISEGIFNSLIVTNSAEENAVLTCVHERLLARTFIPIL